MCPRKLHILLFFTICLACYKSSIGQVHLNVSNGMPSNHVYQMVKDKYGYLWMATNNGVVRYNGYDLKIYTTANGLPSNDIWSIHLDRKERLWLLCFANSLGYIYKNKYHKTYVSNDNQILSTERVGEHKDGIAFITKYRDPFGYSLFKEKNDTLTNLKNGFFIWTFYLDGKGHLYYNPYANDRVYTYDLSDDKFRIKNRCTYDTTIRNLWKLFNNRFSYYHHEIMYSTEKNIVFSLNLTTCKHDTLVFPDGPIVKVLHTDEYLYVLSDNMAYRFDSNMARLDTAHMADITGGQASSASDLVYLFEDELWGKTIATQSHGMSILPRKKNLFTKFAQLVDPGYKYIGGINDSAGYWWHAAAGTMAVVTESSRVQSRTYASHDPIKKIIPIDNERALLPSNNFPRLFNIKTGAISNLTHYRSGNSGPHLYVTEALAKKDTIFAINSSNFYKLYPYGDTVYNRQIHFDRYTGITYDSLRNLIWVYNTGKILLYDQHGNITLIPDVILRHLNLTSIEQILTDNVGNIFIKDGDKLLSIAPQRFSYHRLFQQSNLADAKIFKQRNTLIAIGKFGAAFYKIYGTDSFSEPVYYYNEKFASYRTVHDVQVLRNTLLLKTDNGFYTINIPNDNQFRGPTHSQPFTLILDYNDDLYKPNSNDSFRINQENRRVVFDIIKPSGSGQVRYQYMIAGTDSSWHELANNELTLSDLQPGAYHTLLLSVRDEAWRSPPIRLHFYIIPYWWQANPGRTILWLAGILILCALIMSTILITRRIIMQNNLKKNKLLELEIKSIHSQINPHFIFNTLNTTLHYIVKRKLDEAYDHVSSFSSLLRAYLKSSRNRYVTLGEEINNLRNYIHLQQTRFENTFTYDIVTDIPQGKTVFIPSMLLQPIVENAINHGLLPKNAPGHLKLSFAAKAHTDKLICNIDDDGVGRKHSATNKSQDTSQRESYGSYLINELVDILNKYENAGIEITYIDKELPQTGTTVIITIENSPGDINQHKQQNTQAFFRSRPN